MSKVAVVTDSTAYIPGYLLKNLDITIIPLHLIWGDENLLDGVDITPKEFYARLRTTKIMPSTSQPTPHAFLTVYQQLLDDGYDVLSVHISSKLSGTVSSAIQAKEMIGESNIMILDSQVTSMALGFPVLKAARAAADGATLNDCFDIAQKACLSSGALFTVDTLEFLHRGGRIGSTAAFLGTALNLKPLLGLIDGKIEAVEKIRTRNKAIDKMVDTFIKQQAGYTSVSIAVVHADCPADAMRVLEICKNHATSLPINEAVITEVSPVIGTHAGPGTVGITYTLE